MNSELIEIKTILESRDRAEYISTDLVVSHLVASAKVTEIHTTYYNAGIFHSDNVSELSCITIDSKYNEVINHLKKCYQFMDCKFVVTPLISVSEEFDIWVKEQVSIKKKGKDK